MRELGFFEWVVIDNCNLRCSYCVNKGEYSHKNINQMLYKPGFEITIASRLLETSKSFKKVIVNLTGGEPTVAPHIEEAVNILASAGNIELRLITNMRAIKRFKQIVPYLSHVTISLHVGLRSEQEIANIISVVKEYKDKLHVHLSQVDGELSSEDFAVLSRIQKETGKRIRYLTFIPPWTKLGKNRAAEKIAASRFNPSLGKRCALGYFFFLIEADGVLHYDLWCASRQKDNCISLISNEFEKISAYWLTEMKQCPTEYCGCNYNFFFHDIYRRECHAQQYPSTEMFSGRNERILSKLSRLVSMVKTELAF